VVGGGAAGGRGSATTAVAARVVRVTEFGRKRFVATCMDSRPAARSIRRGS
jgi:hypothetical protein